MGGTIWRSEVRSKIRMSVFKALKPSFPGKHKPRAGERGRDRLTDVCGAKAAHKNKKKKIASVIHGLHLLRN